MLDKLTGTYKNFFVNIIELLNNRIINKKAPRPSSEFHKLRECLPLVIFLRNRLKYALIKKEVQSILTQHLLKVNGKVRIYG
ncbi:hypothetical protein C2G38_2062948 [Gigaspora rosea]|uniref:Uncharacterized protein n=1 Tax=Gigaspora rosea TaxID=44941 RepID=A0A397W710_9GLOM|nr:hypothetical protein C2G38_2062948 [Gigaspora rosea]